MIRPDPELDFMAVMDRGGFSRPRIVLAPARRSLPNPEPPRRRRALLGQAGDDDLGHDDLPKPKTRARGVRRRCRVAQPRPKWRHCSSLSLWRDKLDAGLETSRPATYGVARRCQSRHRRALSRHVIGGQRGVYDKHRYVDEMRHAFEALASQI